MSTDPQSRSISELTRELTEQTSRLAQKEIEPAKVDLSAKGKETAPESPQEAQALVKQNPRPFAIAGGVVFLLLLWRWSRS